MKPGRTLAASLLVASLCASASATELGLNSMMHSLLRVQDQIAQGDAAALPLQTHLMQLMDASISEIGRHRRLSRSEVDALVIYAIVGTGSDAVIDVLHQAGQQKQHGGLVDAVIEYRKRNRREALQLFDKVKPDEIGVRIEPFVAFARGNLQARDAPAKAAAQYDIVRLTAPGTLLEEATLRRLLALHTAALDGVSFIKIAKQYSRRFIRSPYRQQFLGVLKRGILALRRRLDDGQIADLAQAMKPRFAASFYMHIVRAAIVSGHLKLADFGLKQLVDMVQGNDDITIDKAQLALLQAMSGITSDDPREVRERLAAIDRNALQPADRQLLEAAENIVATLSAPVNVPETSREVEQPAPSRKRKQTAPVERVKEAKVVRAAATSPAPSSDDKPDDEEQAEKAREDAREKALDGFINDTARKLDSIDNLLSE